MLASFPLGLQGPAHPSLKRRSQTHVLLKPHKLQSRMPLPPEPIWVHIMSLEGLGCFHQARPPKCQAVNSSFPSKMWTHVTDSGSAMLVRSLSSKVSWSSLEITPLRPCPEDMQFTHEFPPESEALCLSWSIDFGQYVWKPSFSLQNQWLPKMLLS